MQTVFIIAWIIILTAFYTSAVIIASFLSPNADLPHKIARLWGGAILFVSGIRVKVIGQSNLDPSHPHIYMCNHQSNFDIPVVLAHLKVQFRWLAKAELFKVPLFGYGMKRAEAISIDRSDRRSAMRSLKQAAQTIRNGASVVIFPEGTRSLDGNIRDFKKGGFVLAADSGIPIVPVIVHGTRAIMPKNRLDIKPGDVVLEIRPRIDTSGGLKNKDEISNKVRTVICESFEQGRPR